MSLILDRTSNYGTCFKWLFFHSKYIFIEFCSHITISFSSRYFLRATIGRRLSDITKELDIVVHTLSIYPELNSSIKMEVGIEDCLHIEFEYNRSKYVVFNTQIK